MKKMSLVEKPILFDRVASILDQARDRVLRTVNQQMVLAYGLIGREIVLEVLNGKHKASYGEDVIRDLSAKLTSHYGKGYSLTHVKDMRQFYVLYRERIDSTPQLSQISHTSGGLFEKVELSLVFSAKLGWSHYRSLMRIKNPDARDFYEREAVAGGWNVAELNRQIHSQVFERGVKTPSLRSETQPLRPQDIFRSPTILEFLSVPEAPALHESHIEQAIVDNLQAFMLELGKGFAFVARQRQLRFEDQLYYVDLVFYNYLLKCFVLVDLKIGEITHQDVGPMDGYVRLFEDQYKVAGDSPTVGIILCSAHNAAVARYSVLKEAETIFASRYLLYLPSESELVQHLQRERIRIEQLGSTNEQGP